nr:YidC/Oxa1 family insertase periplasmic-domain containing protein [uncultured Holophaga sp.]
MNNRNLVAFIICMLVLFGLYSWVMRRNAPPKQAQEVAQAAQAPAVAPPPVSGGAAPAQAARPADTSSLVTVESSELRLRFRTQDGAIQQVEWKADGTPFLPSMSPDGSTRDFPGIGGALSARFEGSPEIASTPEGKVVTFRNAQGDRLEYRVPEKGYALKVSWSSPSGSPLNLIAMPHDLAQANHLGRIFTLEESGIHDQAWTSILKDPFFKFVGAKRKTLPDATRMVGMDAGIEHAAKSQRTHYFAAIWEMPRLVDRDPGLGYTIRPEGQQTLTGTLYLGPKQADVLAGMGKAYTKVMNFGFFGLVAQFLFWILRQIQRVIPNWGWAILVFSLIIRGILWPLNTKTTLGMIRMKELEPHQKEIQAKYAKFGNDMAKKQEQQKELMAFYKKNGHNPMGGCLPMVVQMPVFLALWSMLAAVYELRHAHFALWLTDLSAQDPYYILPILLGASMLLQQKMTPMAGGDAAQKKMMMYVMPLMMIFFFGTTPAGLCLYYLVFNLVGIAQTWYLLKTYKSKPVVI